MLGICHSKGSNVCKSVRCTLLTFLNACVFSHFCTGLSEPDTPQINIERSKACQPLHYFLFITTIVAMSIRQTYVLCALSRDLEHNDKNIASDTTAKTLV